MRRVLGDRATERLDLRRWDPVAHTEGLERACRSPAVMRFLGGAPLTPAEAAYTSERIGLHWALNGFGLWAAVERASGRTIGFVGLSRPDWIPGFEDRVEVGWRLAEDTWNQGYATEAAREAVAAARDELGLDEVVSLVHPDNSASIRVCEKLGMTEGERVAHPTRHHELIVYTLPLTPD